jgi:hypothetical protein
VRVPAAQLELFSTSDRDVPAISVSKGVSSSEQKNGLSSPAVDQVRAMADASPGSSGSTLMRSFRQSVERAALDRTRTPQDPQPESREELLIRIRPWAEQLCLHLFPAGRRQGGSVVLRSFDGEPGQSLRICVAGKYLGTWRDCSLGGVAGNDLVALWSKARGISDAEAVNQIAEWLGDTYRVN